MTMFPGQHDDGWPDAPAGPRHAARSPSGSFLPPVDEDESVTAFLPRLTEFPPLTEEAPGGGQGGPDAEPATTWMPRPADEPTGRHGRRPSSYSYGAAGDSHGLAGDSHGPAEDSYGLAGDSYGPAEGSYGPAGDLYGPADGLPGGVGGDAGQEAWAQPAARPAAGPSALRLIWIFPDLLSTYGDRGNLIMLTRRARLRGIEVAPVELTSDQPVPQQGDIYLLGGGEDLPQILAAQRLRAHGGLTAAVAGGAVVFAVCAGYQLVGTVFGGSQGEPVDGLGILDVRSGRGERRGVGEVLADVDPALGVDRLTGFENHQGVTTVGPSARPLARVLAGVGNGDGTEGAYGGRVLGTYLHGPALVRNPGLADLLLSWVVGALPPLPDADEAWTRQLRAERLAAVPA